MADFVLCTSQRVKPWASTFVLLSRTVVYRERKRYWLPEEMASAPHLPTSGKCGPPAVAAETSFKQNRYCCGIRQFHLVLIASAATFDDTRTGVGTLPVPLPLELRCPPASLLVWRAAGQLGDANRWSLRNPFRRFRQKRVHGKNAGRRRVRVFSNCNRHVQSRCGYPAGHLPGRAIRGRHRGRRTQDKFAVVHSGCQSRPGPGAVSYTH